MFSTKAILLMVLVPLLQPQFVHSSLNSDLEELFERLKEWMPYLDCYDPDLPVLEPLYIKKFDFDIDHEIGKLKGVFKETNIARLSKFELNEVKVVPISGTFKVNVSIPALAIDGQYVIDGNIGELIPLTGEGPFEINLKDINVVVDGKLNIGISITMKELSIGFKVNNFIGHFYGLYGGEPELEEVFNKIINQIALEALDVLWPEIEVVLTEMMKKEANKMLADLTLNDLLNLQKEIRNALPLDKLEACEQNHGQAISYNLL